MAKTVFSIAALLALIGLAAACASYYPPSTAPSQQNPPQPNPPPQTQNTAITAPKQQSGPSLNIAIDYIGVVSASNPLSSHSANVKLAVVVSDSKTVIDRRTVPSTGWQPMKDFGLWEVNIKGLHIDSATDYLRLSIVAFAVDPNMDWEKSWASALEGLGQPGASNVKAILDSLPAQWYLGEYENTWYPSQNWGIGPHNPESGSNLRVWFRIWSNQEPEPSSTPLFQPEVKIERVILPSTVSLGYIGLKHMNHTLVLTNNENTDVTIDYFGDSDLWKELYKSPVKGTVQVPGGGSREVTHSFRYSKAGTNTVTYIIKYDGKELNRWSGTVTVTP